MVCLALRPGLKRSRQEFERQGAGSFAYMGDASLGLTGITANTIRAFAFLRRELDDIGIMVNAAKTVALPPKGHSPTVEKISLLESIEVLIADKEGVTVVGVPIGTEEYVLGRAMEVVRDGGADHLASSLANMPDKQAAALITVESLGQRTSFTSKGLWTRVCPSKHEKSRQRGPVGVRETTRITGRAGGTTVFPGGVSG